MIRFIVEETIKFASYGSLTSMDCLSTDPTSVPITLWFSIDLRSYASAIWNSTTGWTRTRKFTADAADDDVEDAGAEEDMMMILWISFTTNRQINI